MLNSATKYDWNDGQYRPVGFKTNDKPISFTPAVLIKERSKVIPADPDQCLICGFYFDHYREGKAGLCARCILQGLPDKIRVIIKHEEAGRKVVSYYRPNIIDQLKTGEEEDVRTRKITTRAIGRNIDRGRVTRNLRRIKRATK